MRMRINGRPLMTSLVLAMPAIGLACGVCVDDKVAATYDHVVIMQAAAKRQLVVFAEVSGSADVGTTLGNITRRASGVRGVQQGTITTSDFPAAFSFVLDPAKSDPASAISQIQQRLNDKRLTVSILRVVDAEKGLR
jgi:hypothetical protein